MNLGLVRFIDYWVGVPTCFFLSLIGKILPRKTVKPDGPKKILFLEFSEMGSAILSYSAMVKAKRLYPDAELYFWIFEENKKILSSLNIIPKKNIVTIRFRPALFFLIDVVKSIHIVRKEKIDTALDLELFSRFSAIMAFMSGAGRISGFYKYDLEGLYRGEMQTHKVKYNPYLHIRNNFISLVDSLEEDRRSLPLSKKGVSEGLPALPDLKIEQEEKGKIREKIKKEIKSIEDKKIITVRFDFSDRISLRMWPRDKYINLIKRLLKNENLLIVLEGEKREKIPEFINEARVINFTGVTTLRELLALFSISQVVAGHDGGIIHMASLTGAYIVALYGPETPLLYGPLNENKTVLYKNLYCSPCVTAYNHRSSVCNDNVCMKRIKVDQVYQSVLDGIL